MKKLTTEELCRRLAAGEIVPCSAEQWKELAGEFPVKTTIATGLAGDLLLVRRPVPGPQENSGLGAGRATGPRLARGAAFCQGGRGQGLDCRAHGGLRTHVGRLRRL